MSFLAETLLKLVSLGSNICTYKERKAYTTKNSTSTAKFVQGLVTWTKNELYFVFHWNVNGHGGSFLRNSSGQSSLFECPGKQFSDKVSSVSLVYTFRTHIKAVQEQKQHHRLGNGFAIGFEASTSPSLEKKSNSDLQ